MTEFLFGFRDLTNISDPKTPILNLGSLVLTDTFVRKFNPKRYNFYVKFINGLSNPANLYKFLYKTKESKTFHNDLENKIKTISKSLHLLSNEDKKKVIDNLKLVLDDKDTNGKDGKYDEILKYLENQINEKKTGGDKNYVIKKNLMPMKSFIEDANEVFPGIGNIPPTDINELVKETTEQEPVDRNASNEDKNNIRELKAVYNKYNSISQISPERVNINYMDRGVFIATTMIIRLLSLSLIYWGLNSNLINNFKTAFLYYCIIYIIFFLFIIGLVNVIYYYPVVELFSNVSLVSIPNLLYYFYIHINGINRLLLHIIIILTLLAIPFILSLDTIEPVDTDETNENINISFDNIKKDKIYTTITNFSLVIWALTSIIALKF
jgi:hypothetical protein